jgi:hypothetical protein
MSRRLAGILAAAMLVGDRRPAGPTVTFVGRTQISRSDGSYRLDLGCPTDVRPFGTGTTSMVVNSPGYVTQQPVGNHAEFLPADGLQRVGVNLQPAASGGVR